MSEGTGRPFLDVSREKLAGEYLPKIRRCVDELEPEDVWWRPNDVSNSVGNLMLHLAGNTRQWIVSGVGGAEDVRRRSREFARREGDPEAAYARLDEAVEEAGGVLRDLDPAGLGETRTIQGTRVSVLEAVYHVVEHFSMHTGQIVFVTKLRTGRDLRFYRVDEAGDVEENW